MIKLSPVFDEYVCIKLNAGIHFKSQNPFALKFASLTAQWVEIFSLSVQI